MECLGNTLAVAVTPIPFLYEELTMTSRLSALVFGLMLSAAPGLLQAAPDATSKPGKTLQKTDTVVGSGRLAMDGSTVTMHYTGWLFSPKSPKQHGSQFDSSTNGKGFSFKVGAGSVIKGWDEGVRGMKVGGKRTLIVPAEMAFGDKGLGPVPPKSNLIFDIELMDVK
jgi:FKBP-type peptidyl-prolyl cis-trans isomerase FkpA